MWRGMVVCSAQGTKMGSILFVPSSTGKVGFKRLSWFLEEAVEDASSIEELTSYWVQVFSGAERSMVPFSMF